MPKPTVPPLGARPFWTGDPPGSAPVAPGLFMRRELGTRKGAGMQGRVSGFPDQQGGPCSDFPKCVSRSSPSSPPKEGMGSVQMEAGGGHRRKASIIWADLGLPPSWEISRRPRPLTWGGGDQVHPGVPRPDQALTAAPGSGPWAGLGKEPQRAAPNPSTPSARCRGRGLMPPGSTILLSGFWHCPLLQGRVPGCTRWCRSCGEGKREGGPPGTWLSGGVPTRGFLPLTCHRLLPPPAPSGGPRQARPPGRLSPSLQLPAARSPVGTCGLSPEDPVAQRARPRGSAGTDGRERDPAQGGPASCPHPACPLSSAHRGVIEAATGSDWGRETPAPPIPPHSGSSRARAAQPTRGGCWRGQTMLHAGPHHGQWQMRREPGVATTPGEGREVCRGGGAAR